MKYHFAMIPAATVSVLLLIITLASCTVETTLEIRDDASGRAQVTVTLHPVSVMYMTDIVTSFGGSAGSGMEGPFDVDSIRRSFQARSGVELESITTVGKDTLHLTVGFDDVRNLLSHPPDMTAGSGRDVSVPPAENPVTFITNTGGNELRLQISRSNFYRISSLFILPDSPVTVLLPYAETDFMQKEEYLDVLAYALEDYLGDVSAGEFMESSGVHATVIPGSPVTAATGGEIAEGAAVFEIPLIDLLTLEEEIGYSVLWKSTTPQ